MSDCSRSAPSQSCLQPYFWPTVWLISHWWSGDAFFWFTAAARTWGHVVAHGRSPCRTSRDDGVTMLEFSVRINYLEYLSFVKFQASRESRRSKHGASERNAPPMGLLMTVSLAVFATLVYPVKKWRVPSLLFRIDESGIQRVVKGRAYFLSWHEVTLATRMELGWVLELKQGLLPIPVSTLNDKQENTLRDFLANNTAVN